mgnify:FL=1
MINLDTAINMAQTYIDESLKNDHEYTICDDEIFEDDGGWYIPFQPIKFIQSKKIEDTIVGNWPIFVSYQGKCFGMWRPTKLGGRPPIDENMQFGWKPNIYQ